MALNGTVLGDLMMSKIETAIAAHQTAGPAQREAVFHAMGAAIVEHILTATVTVTVASVSGVTSGASLSGSGTGSGTIT